MKASEILETAAKVVDGDRQRDYGHPADNHGATADLWTAYLGRRFGHHEPLNANDVCMMMILLKVSREANRHTDDNLVDIVGYALNDAMVRE